MKLNTEVTNLLDFVVAAKEVVRKAEELESAVQRLNDIKLEVQTKVIDE